MVMVVVEREKAQSPKRYFENSWGKEKNPGKGNMEKNQLRVKKFNLCTTTTVKMGFRVG